MTGSRISDSRLDAAQSAELKQLGDIDIDDVLGILDRDVPDYRQLYYRWESQQWEAGSIDLTDDLREWNNLDPDLKRSLGKMLSSLYAGAEQITHALVPFVDALPTEEQQVFLTTQLVDGARHTVFFDRLFSEVLDGDGDDMESRLKRQAGELDAGARSLLTEMLPAASERIRRDLTDLDSLIEGVTLLHIVVVSTLGITAQRYILNSAREIGSFRGLRQGLTAVARDETRHVGFGVRFLKEAVHQDPHCAELIQRAVRASLPLTLSALDPSDERKRFALNSLNNRLRAIGVEL
ncbi:MAG: ribonucleoside-diphosphate reductase beta chain [Actinomycetota bacterium]|jgi:ribonucleoside-diphosphate reductase beta chain|nr:ribonucleoside-diphosphate reductase beta chain [Actinomycetota bacterium]